MVKECRLGCNTMGKITTKEVLDGYYKSVAGTSAVLTRPQIDKAELYNYEIKIGKEFIDMDVDELFGLIFELKNKRKGKEISYMVSHSSYDQISTLFRAIFNWYIDNVEVIKNPLNDKRMKGKEATKRLAKGRQAFRWDIVEDVIEKLHRDKDQDNADYIELIMLMYYNGFAKAEEIVKLQPEMIDHRNHAVKLPGRTIRLSERCYELLEKFHNMDEIEGWRGNFLMASWHNSYFKFIIRKSQEFKINERPMTAMCDILNRALSVNVNDKYDMKINYHILYLLGFYDFIVKKYGETKTDEMLVSYRNSDDVTALMGAAKEYGVDIDNISHLKRYLRPFIKED